MSAIDFKELSSEELAVKCQAGCRDSFEMLVKRFETRVFHFICRFIGNPHDAEDLTQDTFVSAFKGIQRYEPAFAFSTWLFTIAKRAALSHFRSHRADHGYQPDPRQSPATSGPSTPGEESSFEAIETSSLLSSLFHMSALKFTRIDANLKYLLCGNGSANAFRSRLTRIVTKLE